MEIDSTDFLRKMLIIIPLGISAIFLCIKGMKKFSRFLYFDYQGNSKKRFKDNFLSTLYMCAGVVCIFIAIMVFQIGPKDIKSFFELITVATCIGAFILPISMLGAYWRSYQINKLWGGFIPTVRARYGYAQPDLTTKQKIDPSKIKIPHRVTITAGAISLLVFFGMLYFLSKVEWNGSIWAGIILLFLFSGFSAFGVFMTIVSNSLSRRFQKLRDGDPLDDD